MLSSSTSYLLLTTLYLLAGGCTGIATSSTGIPSVRACVLSYTYTHAGGNADTVDGICRASSYLQYTMYS